MSDMSGKGGDEREEAGMEMGEGSLLDRYLEESTIQPPLPSATITASTFANLLPDPTPTSTSPTTPLSSPSIPGSPDSHSAHMPGVRSDTEEGVGQGLGVAMRSNNGMKIRQQPRNRTSSSTSTTSPSNSPPLNEPQQRLITQPTPPFPSFPFHLRPNSQLNQQMQSGLDSPLYTPSPSFPFPFHQQQGGLLASSSGSTREGGYFSLPLPLSNPQTNPQTLPLPSPTFQEQFKYLLCSSSLIDPNGIDAALKFGYGRRAVKGDREGEGKGLLRGMGGAGAVVGLGVERNIDATDTDPDNQPPPPPSSSLILSPSAAVPIASGSGLARARSRSGDESRSWNGSGVIGLGLGLGPRSTTQLTPSDLGPSVPPSMHTTPLPLPIPPSISRVPSSTSTVSSMYMTASSASGSRSGSSAGSTPVMNGGGVWMLPLVDFEVIGEGGGEGDSREGGGRVVEVEGRGSALREGSEGLRRRRRRSTRDASVHTQTTPAHSSTPPANRSKSKSKLSSRKAPASTWTTLLLSLLSFILRSFATILGLLVVWGWIQVKIVWELGRWGWGLVGSLTASNTGGGEVEMNGHAVGQGNGHAIIGENDNQHVGPAEEVEVAVNIDESERMREEVSPGKALQASALKAIGGMIEESERFDGVVGQSFELLERQESPLDPAKALYLKQRLQDTFKEVSTSFQAASNSISPLVSDQELAVLLKLYGLDDVMKETVSPVISLPNRNSTGSVFAAGHVAVHGSPIGTPAVSRRLFGSHGEEGAQLPFIRLNSSLAPASTSPADRSGLHPDGTVGGLATPSEISRTSSPRPLLLQTHTADEIGLAFPPSTSSSSRRKRPLSLHAVPLAEQNQPFPKRLRTRSYRNSITNIHELEPPVWYRSSAPPEKIDGSVDKVQQAHDLDQQARTAAWARQRMKTLRADESGGIGPPITSPDLLGEAEGTPKIGHPKLRLLRLSAASTSSSTGVSTASDPVATTPRSSQTGSPILHDDSGISSPRRDIRTHQRNRSSLSGLGFRQPTSLLTASMAVDSPKSEARRVSDKSDDVPGLEDFISGLPSDLVIQLKQTSKRQSKIKGGGRKSSTGSRPRSSLRFSHRSDSYALAPSSLRTKSQKASVETSVSTRAPIMAGIDLQHLREAFSTLHLHRRRLSCGLLALQILNNDDNPTKQAIQNDASVQLFWQMMHDVPLGLQQSVCSGIEIIGSALRTARRNPHTQTPSMATSFAPKRSDAQQLQMELETLETILDLAKQRLLDVKHLAVSGSEDGLLLASQWNLLRADLGMMIRDWERGRNIIGRIAGESGPPVTAGQDRDSSSLAPLANDEADDEGFGLPKVDESDIPLPESPPLTVDDASSHLLDSTSPSLLPPPGIEAVFEDFISRLPARTATIGPDGQKLTREQRIAAAKEARQKTTETARAPTEHLGGTGGLQTVDRTTIIRSGEMVDELRDVMIKLRERRERGRDDSPGVGARPDDVGNL